ncbi:MAG: hypothetical protein ACM3ZQ_04375 [Bacillota bacterium]
MRKLVYYLVLLTAGYFAGKAFKARIPVHGSSKRKDMQRLVAVVAAAVALLALAQLVTSIVFWERQPTALDVAALLSIGLFMGVFALRNTELERHDYRQLLKPRNKNKL